MLRRGVRRTARAPTEAASHRRVDTSRSVNKKDRPQLQLDHHPKCPIRTTQAPCTSRLSGPKRRRPRSMTWAFGGQMVPEHGPPSAMDEDDRAAAHGRTVKLRTTFGAGL